MSVRSIHYYHMLIFMHVEKNEREEKQAFSMFHPVGFTRFRGSVPRVNRCDVRFQHTLRGDIVIRS